MKDEIMLVDDSTYEHSENWNSILAELEEKSVSSLIVSSVSSSKEALSFNMTVANKNDAAIMITLEKNKFVFNYENEFVKKILTIGLIVELFWER